MRSEERREEERVYKGVGGVCLGMRRRKEKEVSGMMSRGSNLL